jgi:hypothetical protein
MLSPRERVPPRRSPLTDDGSLGGHRYSPRAMRWPQSESTLGEGDPLLAVPEGTVNRGLPLAEGGHLETTAIALELCSDPK